MERAGKRTIESGHYFRPIERQGEQASHQPRQHRREGDEGRHHYGSMADRQRRSAFQQGPRRPPAPSITEAFPGTTSLVQALDKKVLVVLRDGKKYVGMLRTYDQYGNVVLHDAVERVYIGNQYGEQPCGVYLIRGENIMLLGEVDPLKDASLPLEKRPMIEMLSKQKELIEESRRLYRLKRQIQRDFGLLDSEITLMMDADV